MNRRPCEYCGADLPEGVDKSSRRQRTQHFMSCEKRAEQRPPAPKGGRRWVGLTEEQRTVIWANSLSVDEAIRATEKQLKENNS